MSEFSEVTSAYVILKLLWLRHCSEIAMCNEMLPPCLVVNITYVRPTHSTEKSDFKLNGTIMFHHN